MLSCITAGVALAGSMSAANAVENTNAKNEQEVKVSKKI